MYVCMYVRMRAHIYICLLLKYIFLVNANYSYHMLSELNIVYFKLIKCRLHGLFYT